MTQEQTGNMGFTLGGRQIEVFVAGLYRLASCDGITEFERDIVKQFADDSGAGHLLDNPDALSFDPVDAYRILETSWLRKLFLRAALLVVQADGKITDDEQETIAWIASAFGIEGGYTALAQEVEGESF